MRNVFLSILFSAGLIWSQYAPNLAPDNDLDQLILRLSTRYGIALPDNFFCRPYNYEDICTFFSKISQKDSSYALSQTETYLLNKALVRFGPRNHLLRWTNNDSTNLIVNLGLLGDLRPSYYEDASVDLKGILRPSLSGSLGRLSFYSSIRVWTELHSDTTFHPSSYQPYDGIPYNLYGRNTAQSDIRSSDIPTGGIYYNAGRIELETAIDYLRLGPAIYYPVTLSGTTPPITYFKGRLNLKFADYTHIVGLLRSQKDKPKYIYVHRLDVPLLKSRLNFGFNEVIINGSTTNQCFEDTLNNSFNPDFVSQDRGWEWVYLIPFVPFKFVEHYAGDRDNAAMSFDFSLNYPTSFRWYMELFFDDLLAPWKMFSNDWGNKWAATLGFQYFGLLWNRDFEFSSEYSHVEPWVYTHIYGGSHSYTHFGQCLGSTLGPNSQAIKISAQIQADKFNKLGLQFTCEAKNDSVRGGDVNDIFHYNIDSITKKFLGPGTVWYGRPGISWTFNPFGRFSVNALYEIDLLEKAGRSSVSLWGGLQF